MGHSGDDVEKMRTILKFDTGADGFKKMVIVLGVAAVVVLMIGIYFLNMVINEMRSTS